MTTLNMHETLSTARDFFNRTHRNEKHLVVGLRLNTCNCIMAWKAKQWP